MCNETLINLKQIEMIKEEMLKSIKLLLAEYEDKKVAALMLHVEDLYNDKKVNWIQNQNPKRIVALFKTTLDQTELHIDGDMVRLSHTGGKAPKLTVDFDYRAYKNRVLKRYPTAIFDHAIVYKNDRIAFQKDSGKVIYKHEIANRFESNKKIIGAYCIIKTPFGEFLETIDNDDIKKIRGTAKTDYIWEQWTSRMVLKSIIKRACNVHFKDIMRDLDNLDNENYTIGKSPDDVVGENPIQLPPKPEKKKPGLRSEDFSRLLVAIENGTYSEEKARKDYSFSEEQENELLLMKKNQTAKVNGVKV